MRAARLGLQLKAGIYAALQTNIVKQPALGQPSAPACIMMAAHLQWCPVMPVPWVNIHPTLNQPLRHTVSTLSTRNMPATATPAAVTRADTRPREVREAWGETTAEVLGNMQSRLLYKKSLPHKCTCWKAYRALLRLHRPHGLAHAIHKVAA